MSSPVGRIPEQAHPTAAYDNNNEANVAKLKQHQDSGGAPGPARPPKQAAKSSGVRPCGRLHLNSLWSVWYGFFGTFLQAYIAVKCTKRFLRYSVLPWTNLTAVWELHGCLVATGLAVILLPLFLASAVFKVGNFANDGFKLGKGSAKLTTPTSSAPCGALWRHAGPTAAFLHLVIAITLLAPRLVMEARLVQHGFLPADALWRTDLDFMVVHHDRLVVLSFMTAASPSVGPHGSNITTTTPPPGTLNHTADAIALTAFNNSTQSILEASVHRSLATDVLEFLKDMLKMTDDNPHRIDSHIEPGFGSTVSVEYINYAIALLVYSVRYPAVFWGTNKCFGIIFSIQLLANSIQSLLAFAGMSVLYKVQVVGAYKALPLLRHFPKGASPLGNEETPFLLNSHVTLALFALSSFLVLASSMILYLYGHARYNSFLSSYKDRSAHITSMGPTGSGWGYRTHGAALAALIASAVAHAPLLHDLTVVYRGSLDGAVLACIVGDITTLFLWVVVWLGLTIKYRWTFKVTITVGRATVRSARSVRLVTDVELAGRRPQGPSQAQPLLVVGNGRAYAVSEPHSRKAIMSVVQKTQQAKQQQQTVHGVQSAVPTAAPGACLEEDGEEQIYWLRAAGASPQRSPDSVAGGPLCWRGRSHSTHSTSSTSTSTNAAKKKHKVTFNEATSMSKCSGNKGLDGSGSVVVSGRVSGLDEDDGDYATLRELPLRSQPEDDATSEEGKLLACVHDDSVTYASTSRDLIPPIDYEDPSPLLTPEPHNVPAAATVLHPHALIQTPRCLRRADSGMPPEESLTPRSDSVSTESQGSSASESSSGVHSTSSVGPTPPHHPVPSHRRATSSADLQLQQPPLGGDVVAAWKSCSLQRNITMEQTIPVVVYGSASAEPTAVILETSGDNTVVIRRKATKPEVKAQIPVITEEPFSRSTNMKMTSFTEYSTELKATATTTVQASSATLPHFPTQPPIQQITSYPHCSTMPLPHNTQNGVEPNLAAGTSCNLYGRQHSTIPTHHNGVRLFPVKRVQQNLILNGRLNANNNTKNRYNS